MLIAKKRKEQLKAQDKLSKKEELKNKTYILLKKWAFIKVHFSNFRILVDYKLNLIQFAS